MCTTKFMAVKIGIIESGMLEKVKVWLVLRFVQK